MRHPLLELELANDRDMIAARQRARQVSALLDFDAQDQVRIATAVSEVARNAVRHGGGGRIEFALEEEGGHNPALSISVADKGPGIADFETAVGGTTPTGEPKLGLVTARRLMDDFEIRSAPRTCAPQTKPRRGSCRA
jgi:anti-sigma regulatory factor (Ser/Thr protein kinase)